jgi:photosystem II stability/assembly factor-like uncharacterized protein
VSTGSLFSAAHSADFGQTWTAEGDLPAAFQGAGDLSCAAAGACLVAGYVPTTAGHGQGAVALSTDGGQTWALASVPASAGVLQSAACLTATACLAAGTTGTTVSDVVPAQGQLLQSADGGHTWTASTAKTPLAVDDVFGVACPSARVCALVGTKWSGQPAVGTGAVAQSRDGGATFAASSSAYVPLALSALSCPAATGCVAVGGDTVARVTLLPPKPPSHGAIRPSGSSQQ